MKLSYHQSMGIALLLVCVVMSAQVFAQYDNDWTPPTSEAGQGNTPPPVNTSDSGQIKRGSLSVDLEGTVIDLPPGAGFFMRAGSLFLRMTGTSALPSWIADAVNAIDTNGAIRSHGLYSTSDITALPLIDASSSAEKTICADVVTGVLKACSLPTLTFYATPNYFLNSAGNTLVWSSNADSCNGGGFNTQSNSIGSILVQPLVPTIYTITCTGANGSVTKSVSITGSGPVFSLFHTIYKWNGSAWVFNNYWGSPTYLEWGWKPTLPHVRYNTYRSHYRFYSIDVLPGATNVQCRSQLSGAGVGFIDQKSSVPFFVVGNNKLNNTAAGVWGPWRGYVSVSDMDAILGTCAVGLGCPLTDIKMGTGNVSIIHAVECRHTRNGVTTSSVTTQQPLLIGN